jgi:hypothetical protein
MKEDLFWLELKESGEKTLRIIGGKQRRCKVTKMQTCKKIFCGILQRLAGTE